MSSSPILTKLKKRIKLSANKEQAKVLQKFFKTGRGEYGEGDKFLGIKVPVQRKIAKQYSSLCLEDIQLLIKSKIHEERLISLFILIDKYNKGNENEKERIFKLYLKNRKHINNWDLVDLSAPKIIGEHLKNRNKNLLYDFAQSENLWEKRIAILSTYTFIKNLNFKITLDIANILLHDEHDLIHKGVGWMLREVGKKDINVLEEYLNPCYRKMPRTMLRYSIERFPDGKRRKYLEGKI